MGAGAGRHLERHERFQVAPCAWIWVQDDGQYACVLHRFKGIKWRGQLKDLEELFRHALARKGGHARRIGCASLQSRRIIGFMPKARRKTKEPQDAQVIFLDAQRRVPNKAHPFRVQIFKPPDGIEEVAVFIGINRVHGKVAAHRIMHPVFCESDLRPSPKGLNIHPQRRDLVGTFVDDGCHGAVVNPGRNDLDVMRAQKVHHPVRVAVDGKIDIADGKTKQPVAHRPPDEPQGRPVPLKEVEELEEVYNITKREFESKILFVSTAKVRHIAQLIFSWILVVLSQEHDMTTPGTDRKCYNQFHPYHIGDSHYNS